MPESFDERRVTRLARVVAVVGLQFGGPVGVPTGRVGPPREARIAGRRVQAGESRHVGRRRCVEQLLGPGERLEQLHREAHQRGVSGDVGRDLHLAACSAPPESGPEVAELELDPVDRVAPPGPVPPFPLRDGPAPELGGVDVSRPLTLAGIGESILGELPDRLVQAVARASWRSDSATTSDLRTRESRCRSTSISSASVDDGADARQVEAAGEHRRGAQQRPFVVGQQVVGPLDGVAQRELTLWTRCAPL